ncbi:sodium:solute symporter family protein [Parvularcula dongshanensis]|uniref:Na+/proline symporter n=1 Tax=Parvularcula dongshanensis TaxID=1173995 RepID=A0A840I4Q7_9PROT|nr:sodium:solute symporter family protein [Parvularcula dongshanensis]MBB4659946.1 Na+/proline symporter [Parvularcula dongshanensis]
MGVTTIDLAIIIAYFVLSVGIGVVFSRAASKSTRNYFLGGNKLPWYALGLSNASGMFDISGTMWLVYLLFVYGLKSVWIPWLWPVFNQIFLMMFLSMWLRRSGVVTGAEWITFRFGEGRGARLSHLVVVAFALVVVLAYLAYSFIGIGKFAATFLPIHLSADPNVDATLWGLIVVAITSLYVVKGGMMSVVITEVMQFFIMTVACVVIAWIAIEAVSPDMLAAAVPEGWTNPFFGWRLDLDWSNILPAADGKIAGDGYSLFTFFFLMILVKGVFVSAAGPAPNYDMQRILSARTPREAAMMSGLVSIVLNPPRYLLIAGLSVLALVYFAPELRGMGEDVDFELILPFAMREFVPVGLLGVLIAGLLAAFMSSFAAAVNAAPAYVVNDVYRRYLKPDETEKHYVRLSVITATVFVVLGTAIGLFVPDLSSIIDWLVSALYGGYAAANVLKWYWWRFNGFGYFWGMASGVITALLLPIGESLGLGGVAALDPWQFFPIMLAITTAASIAGTLMTPPTEMPALVEFYRRTRPWGFWGPVHRALEEAEGRAVEPNRDFGIDMMNVGLGIVWQTSLVAVPVFLVIGEMAMMWMALLLAVALTVVFKFTWYDRLKDYPDDVSEAAAEAKASGPAVPQGAGAAL